MSALEPAERWFASRGWEPFAFQREAWRAHLAGESGLVHTATGMGKTYAAWVGPLLDALERGDAGGAGLRALWITPLRALASDTLQALRAACEGLGVAWRVEMRTGDTGSAARRRQRERPPDALVTTPESLSVLLSFPDARERLAGLRTVVVDEWHELLSTKRGVQTELCLARLRAWSPGLRAWGLSATLANLEEAASALVGVDARGEARPARIVRGAGPKRTVVETILPRDVSRFPWVGHTGTASLPGVVEALEGARSALLFTNVRSQCEIWWQALLAARPDWAERMAIHHGSVDRDLRVEAEERLRAGELKCVVCTSSLDLGVDFSPVDRVIQVGSPKGVARMLQRAGRSGHQPGGESRLLCAPTHAFELVEFAAAREAAAAGEIEARPPLRKSLDVLVQHLVTCGCGGGFEEGTMLAEVRSARAFADLTDREWSWALDFVTTGGPTLRAYPERRRLAARVDEATGYAATDARTERLHRMSIGTITGDQMVSVQMINGRRLGAMEEGFIGWLRPGDAFVFAGRALELVRVREMRAIVRPARSRKGAMMPRWMGAKMPLSTSLARAVRRKLEEARGGAFVGAEMEAVRPALEVQARWSRIPGEGELLVESHREGGVHHVFLFPFAGRLANQGLGALLAHRLSREAPRSIVVMGNDYGLGLSSEAGLPTDEGAWRRALTAEGLVEDLLSCVNSSDMARRQFRDIARIAGLIFPGYPGQSKTARQLQASSELYFEVFSEFDPENLLLDQARRETLEGQLEVSRLRATLEEAARSRMAIVEPPRLTPLAFPIWSEFVQAQVSSERWRDRVERMLLTLEEAASAEGSADAVAVGPGNRRKPGTRARRG